MSLVPPPSPARLRKAREQAAVICAHHFGSRPARVVHQAGGQTNYVFRIDHDRGRFVVRIAEDPQRLSLYLKEQWAVTRAREAGVPTPEILEVGSAVLGRPYMISRCSEGREATHHPERLSILREMGRYNALVNSVRTRGYGRTFDWSSNRLSFNDTWRGFLEDEYDVHGRVAVLERRRMLTRPQLAALRRSIRVLEGLRRAPSLSHGDMRLKNVLVDDAGRITAIIDWEESFSAPAPYWDLAIALHDLSIDAKHEFIEGYGLSRRAVADIAPVLKALNVLHYAPWVERFVAGKARAALEQLRLRLTGALDLYSL